MLINVVALEMLKAKLPTTMGIHNVMLPNFHHPRVSTDEDPYSLSPAESSQSGSSGNGLRQSRRDDSNDRLAREDRALYGHWASPNRGGELSDVSEEYATSRALEADYSRGRRHIPGGRRIQHQEDPYYHGLSARVTSFPRQEKRPHDYNKARIKSPARPPLPRPRPR